MQTLKDANRTFKPSAKKNVHVPHPIPRSEAASAHSIAGVLAGNTPNFAVYYDPSLGKKGQDLAKAILQNCETDYQKLQEYFNNGTANNPTFTLVLTTDDTGASHASCDATTLYIGARSGTNVDFIRSLVIAEEDEVFEAITELGWDCGASNGEGLSRVLANDIYPGVEPANFMSASYWLNNGREDFVNINDGTDTNYMSIGCSVLFLNWLRFQLNYSWNEIIRAGAPTLAETYKNLGNKDDCWQTFMQVINEFYPDNIPVELNTDNPFPLSHTAERAKMIGHNGDNIPAQHDLAGFSEAVVSGALHALSEHRGGRLYRGEKTSTQITHPIVIKAGILFEIAEVPQ